MRAGGSERARKETEWENISREQQHHPRDASIKYNENYAIANEVSVRIHTSSGRGSEATVRNHRQGASGASVIVPHIRGVGQIYDISSE